MGIERTEGGKRLLSLGFVVNRGGGGQRVLDKGGREEGRVKRRTNEKHPCRKALSHRPQLSVSTASLPLLLFVLTQTLPH